MVSLSSNAGLQKYTQSDGSNLLFIVVMDREMCSFVRLAYHSHLTVEIGTTAVATHICVSSGHYGRVDNYNARDAAYTCCASNEYVLRDHPRWT